MIQGNQYQEEYGGKHKASFGEQKIMKQSKGMATKAIATHTLSILC